MVDVTAVRSLSLCGRSFIKKFKTTAVTIDITVADKTQQQLMARNLRREWGSRSFDFKGSFSSVALPAFNKFLLKYRNAKCFAFVDSVQNKYSV